MTLFPEQQVQIRRKMGLRGEKNDRSNTAGYAIKDRAVDPCGTGARARGKKILEKPDRPAVDHDAKTITLTWSNGEKSTVSNASLRRACSCALCVDEMTRAPLLDPKSIPFDIHATKVGTIGNYAITVDWSDGHNTGFFPYTTIRELAKKPSGGCGSGSCGCKG